MVGVWQGGFLYSHHRSFNSICSSGIPEHRRETTESFMLILPLHCHYFKHVSQQEYCQFITQQTWISIFVEFQGGERIDTYHSSPKSSCGRYLIQVNYIVPPAEDRSDTAFENNNLAYIGGKKKKQGNDYHKNQGSGYLKTGGGRYSLEGKQRRDVWAGHVPLLDGGYSLCNYALYYTFRPSVVYFIS